MSQEDEGEENPLGRGKKMFQDPKMGKRMEESWNGWNEAEVGHQGLCFMICPFMGCVERHWVFPLHFTGDLEGWEALKEILRFLWYFPLGDRPPRPPHIRGQAAAARCYFYVFLTAQ